MRNVVFLLVFVSLPAFAAGNQIVVSVKGMVCGFCAQGITKKFEKEPAVEKVDVSLEKKIVTLQLKDKQSISDEHVKKLLLESGYNVEKIEKK